jgi:transposase
MIRQETILYKLFLIKLSDMELLEQMKPDYEQCPACGAMGCCEPHDKYPRDMITINKGKRKEHKIFIPRVICNSCGKTHALIADILIPYSSYSLRYVLHVLRAYFNRNCTVSDLCERFEISISTFYDWRNLFKEHANLWLSVLNRIHHVSLQAIDDFENIDMLPSLFFKRYGFSFLQNRQTTHCCRAP